MCRQGTSRQRPRKQVELREKSPIAGLGLIRFLGLRPVAGICVRVAGICARVAGKSARGFFVMSPKTAQKQKEANLFNVSPRVHLGKGLQSQQINYGFEA